MAKMEMDTEKVKALGEDIKKIATKYKGIIDVMYEQIIKLPNSDIWSSDKDKGSANMFVQKATKDRPKMESISRELTKLGNEIISYAESMSSISEETL